jgi:hypothetical protein
MCELSQASKNIHNKADLLTPKAFPHIQKCLLDAFQEKSAWVSANRAVLLS